MAWVVRIKRQRRWRPLPIGDVSITLSTVSLSLTIPAPTVAAAANVTTTTVSLGLTVPAPTVAAGAVPTPATVSPTLTIPAPSISADPTVTLTTVSPALTIPAPSISAGVTITLTTVGPALTVPAPTIALAAQLSTVSPSLTVPAPTVATSTTITVAVVSLVLTIPAAIVSAHRFVTSISGRRLHDQVGDDIIIRCMASWSMPQNLSNADITTALEGIEARHFNAVIVQMFGYNLAGDWDPYTAGNGSAVFTGTPYQSSLGAGWGSMDQVVSEANRLGLTVIMSLYTAYSTQGPRADMEAATNGQMTTFGNSVATRYLAYDNIVWHVGADDAWGTGTTIGARVDAFFEGVNTAEGAGRRPVRLCEPAFQDSGYNQFTAWYGASDVALTVNSMYQYDAAGSVALTDTVHNETGATTIPWWDCESSYRYSAHYGSTSTVEPQEMRERMWTDIIRQGVGINWGNEDFWPFGKSGLFTGARTWQQVLTDADSYWAQYAWDTFTAVGNCAGWTRDSGGFITSGLGTGDTAAASSYSTAKGLVYLPDSRSVTADLTEFSGSFTLCLVSKIDPTTGATTTIGTYSTAGSQVIGALGNNASSTFSDWVLLFEGVPAVEATPATVQPVLTIPAPTISAGVTITTTTVSPSLTIPAPTISAGATVTPSTVTLSLTTPAPTISAGVTITTVVVQPTLTTPAPSISAGVSLTLATVAPTLTTPAPSISAGVTITLATVSPSLTIPAPTIALSATVAVATVAPTLTIPTPLVTTGGDAAASLSAVLPVLTIPAPSAAASTSITLTTVSLTLTAPTPTITTAVAVALSAVSPVLTTPAPTISAGVTITLTTVTAVLSVASVTISTAVAVAVATVPLTLTAPTPSITTADVTNVNPTTVQLALTVGTPTIGADVVITLAVISLAILILVPTITTPTDVTVQVLHSVTRYAHPGMRTYVAGD